MIGKYNKSVILTYIGVLFALTSIFVTQLNYSLIFLILAGICDLFDGKIARKCKRNEEEKNFGLQIDSLSDMFSFIAVPIILGIKYFNSMGMITYIFMGLYVLAGIIRLAWFNIKSEGNTSYYIGVPVTYIALILPVLYLILSILNIDIKFITVTYIVMAFLYVLNIKVKKPNGIWYVIFGIFAIFIVIGLIVLK